MENQHPIPVLFRVQRGELCAYLPSLVWDDRGNITCYARVGQHGSASPIFMGKGRPATPTEYADLLAELQGIYSGTEPRYELKVYKRCPGYSFLRKLRKEHN